MIILVILRNLTKRLSFIRVYLIFLLSSAILGSIQVNFNLRSPIKSTSSLLRCFVFKAVTSEKALSTMYVVENEMKYTNMDVNSLGYMS